MAKRIFFWVTLYSIAMGFLESAVVIYLREVMYPAGFTFPLKPLHHQLAAVELWREFGTIVMLLCVGILAGKNKGERLAYFVYSFAVWDIFYYVFLYVFLSWPESLFTWDILFLIPVPWVGPVISPVIIASTMVLFAVTIIRLSSNGAEVSLKPKEALLLVAGSLVAIGAFVEDYVLQHKTILYHDWMSGGAFLSELNSYVPRKFDWPLFLFAEAILLLAYLLYVRRVTQQGRVELAV